MNEKLAPNLLELIERPAVDHAIQPDQPTIVIISLISPPTPEELDELIARGLTIRSVSGDILTGAIALNQVKILAQHPSIIMIEASGPIFEER